MWLWRGENSRRVVGSLCGIGNPSGVSRELLLSRWEQGGSRGGKGVSEIRMFQWLENKGIASPGPRNQFWSIWSSQKTRNFWHIQQTTIAYFMLWLPPPSFTKINHCCSTLLFYSTIKAAGIYSGILLFSFWPSSFLVLPNVFSLLAMVAAVVDF